jgi:acetyl esterase/lipase
VLLAGLLLVTGKAGRGKEEKNDQATLKESKAPVPPPEKAESATAKSNQRASPPAPREPVVQVRPGEPTVHRDLAYAEPKNERQMLDVYGPAEGTNHPVVVWIHGGGWVAADKKEVHHKPQAFVYKGFVFVSVNYRLLPDKVTI